MKTSQLNWRFYVLLCAFALLLALPSVSNYVAEPFYITLVGRMLILAVAVASLNVLIQFCGLVSFGHALFLGLGAYAVGILSFYDINNGWLQLAATLAACAVVGGITGFIVLRTTGIAFIMITLAFAQMFYFLFVSLRQFGGDDGLPLATRSDFGWFSLDSDAAIYYTAIALLAAVLYATHRLINARFGMVLRGAKVNPTRMAALGYSVLRYQLAAYVLAAMVCGMAGFLFTNLARFTSPSYLAWSLSGELIVMVVLGSLMGLGPIAGALFGALTFLCVEELLKATTEHWQIILGPMIVLGVLASAILPKYLRSKGGQHD